MSDTDQLRGLGQQLAAALVASYGATAPGAKLVFLPGGVSVPVDPDDSMGLVQRVPSDPTKVLVNPTQMQTWLSINFDSPFLVTPGDGSVLEKDSSRGSASQIYTIAVTSAQPLGSVGDDGWTRVDGEIAAAQRKLGQPDATKFIVCEPGDWPLPSANAGYWTTFDSSATQTTSTQTTTPVPAVRPQYWMVRSLAAVAPSPAPPPAPPPPPPAPAPPGPIGRRFIFMRSLQKMQEPLMAARVSPAVSEMAVSPAATAHLEAVAPAVTAVQVHPQLQVAAWHESAAAGLLVERVNTQVLFQNAQPVQTVTTSTSSTIKIHLEHQCVTLGYYSAGQPWWDGVFLADQGWFVPGMNRGGLLPAPDGGPDATYGLPIGLVIVQNLQVSGQWSAEAAAALSSPGGTIGPLSLFGATATTAADGITVTYCHSGMQVVALLCNALPVLPPADAPAAVTATQDQPAPAPTPDQPAAAPATSTPDQPTPTPAAAASDQPTPASQPAAAPPTPASDPTSASSADTPSPPPA